jgi:predicted transcriptional regulator YdeE
MNTLTISKFYVIGLSIRTTNENQQSAKDIPALWSRFMSEGIASRIPNKLDNTIYSVYLDYEKDHTKPYTTLLGCKVKSLDDIPEGFTGKEIGGGNYMKRAVKGNILKGVVFEEWLKIWKSNIPRVFASDYEVYGEKAKDPENAEIDIYLSVT